MTRKDDVFEGKKSCIFHGALKDANSHQGQNKRSEENLYQI